MHAAGVYSILDAQRAKRSVAAVTWLADGAHALVLDDAMGALPLDDGELAETRGRLAANRSGALERLKPDAHVAVVTLTHDPKLDDPALTTAPATRAFYIGSLGSTRTYAKRARLTEAALPTPPGVRIVLASIESETQGRY